MPDSPVRLSFEQSGDIALVCIDNPPVNALSSSVIEGLEQALETFISDEDSRLAVLHCAGRGFIAGADLKEKSSPERSDRAARVISLMAVSTKPIVAAIHGSALGGGLETALACDYRCALSSARFGMPEVNIGAVPGYGGTQRLPRLIGLEPALRMMTTGSTVDDPKALDLGLADRLFEGNLLEQTLDFARELIDKDAPVRKTDLLEVVDRDRVQQLCHAALTESVQSRGGEEAPALIIECAAWAASLPISQGLAYERRVSLSRLQAPQCLAMRYLFFAERQVRKASGVTELLQNTTRHMIDEMLEAATQLVAEGVEPGEVEAALFEFGWAGGPNSTWGELLSERPSMPTSKQCPIVNGSEIVKACLSALVNTGQQALKENTELKAEYLDAEFCQVHRFPRYRGGPMYHGDHGPDPKHEVIP